LHPYGRIKADRSNVVSFLIVYLPLFFIYGNLSELCYSQWNIAVKKQGREVITHQNSYDEPGRLKTKNYFEVIASYQIEFIYY
jgi:hypothetical protein